MSTGIRRGEPARKGLPTWRIVRYADDFVVWCTARADAEALREEVANVLATVGAAAVAGQDPGGAHERRV